MAHLLHSGCLEMASLNDTTVTRRFELHGPTPREVAHRLSLLRQALRAKKGRVLDVEWTRPSLPGPGGPAKASVLYELPLARLSAVG